MKRRTARKQQQRLLHRRAAHDFAGSIPVPTVAPIREPTLAPVAITRQLSPTQTAILKQFQLLVADINKRLGAAEQKLQARALLDGLRAGANPSAE
jgi:hypothetical protein